MHCPRLSELPAPPKGRTGWPWTEESLPCEKSLAEGRQWPRISIVTPSFNQGQFVEETLRSVLLQGYPALEYLVIDGGSTDNSVEIIKKYSAWLTYWVSEPDSGQSDAINRGLQRASGHFATWINSDDLLCKNALRNHAIQNKFDNNTVYVGNCQYVDEDGNILFSHHGRVHSLKDLVNVKTVWRSGGRIVQPEVLFPLQLALNVGLLNPNNHSTMDYELWGKFFLAGAKFEYTNVNFGMFRQHQAQKTQDGLRQTRSLLDVAGKLVAQAACFSEQAKTQLLADLDAYDTSYPSEYWRATGRLARIGLPHGIVRSLRRMNASLQKTAKIFFKRQAQKSTRG